MAGQYPDVPGVRVPYHADGSLVRYAATISDINKTISGAWTAYTAGEAAEMNDGDTTDVQIGSQGSGTGRYATWLFPQPVNITGHNLLIALGGVNPTMGSLEYSSNTTDGADGTWSTVSSDNSASTGAALRSITTVSWTAVRGIRIHMAGGSGGTSTFTARDVAFYGTWTPATLAGWHPTLDQQIGGADLDYGDIALGAAVTKQFRIKNGSAATANNVVVSIGDGNSITVAGLAVSLDNSTFATTRTITSIAPGAISPVVYLRRTVTILENTGNIGIAPVKFAATTWT